MKYKIFLTLVILNYFIPFSLAQVFYVSSQQGNDDNVGNLQAPYKTLSHAISIANLLTGQSTITIKMMPGVYVLNDKVAINPVRITSDSTPFIIEAYHMPDEENWKPEMMPIVQSISPNNSNTQFDHATGLLVSAHHVVIRGIKFLGNTNPEVVYYYPITREDPDLKYLEVSQCYFIGERNSSVIQGGIWAHGQNININHCIFKDCRNAILVFSNIDGCVIQHNIIEGAYESAFWVGENNQHFEFSNNVIFNCNYFWTNSYSGDQTYTLKNSIITGYEHYLGKWNQEKYGLVEINNHKFRELGVRRQGKVSTVTRTEPAFPHNYLHLLPEATGYELNAGIFKK